MNDLLVPSSGGETEDIQVQDILPNDWNTKIIEKKIVDEDNLRIHFFVDIPSKEHFKKWLVEFENLTGSSYVIRSTDVEDGTKVLLKQRLVCQHFTRCKKTYTISPSNRTRNTNCPSKMYVKIHAIRKNYQGKQKKYDLIKKMPCEITLIATHNHSTGTPDSLRFRKVSDSTKEELISLYQNGHSPGTALQMIKYDIQINNDDYLTALADRNQCPSYNFCYNLYMKEFKMKYKPCNFDSDAKLFLRNKLNLYNEKHGHKCAKIVVTGQENSDYVIGICSPIMKRVHKYIEYSNQIVFMDSTGTVDRDGSRTFVLLTDSECGALPLGIMITTSQSVNAIKYGFEILKDILGEDIFGGHEEGPIIFMTNDSLDEQQAVEDTWPQTKCLLCVFHVLQAVYRWLSKSKNGVSKEDQPQIYQDFQEILYSDNIENMFNKYELAVTNAKMYPKYLSYLNNYWWPKKELWVKAYRNSLINENHTNNDSEDTIRQFRDQIFSRIKTFNVVQMVDFMLNKFEQYNEKTLLDASSNRLRENPLCKDIEMPHKDILERIVKLHENIFAVPSESQKNLMYIVNLQILMCSCMEGITGSICKHIDWANMLYSSDKYVSKIDDYNIRQKLHFIATGMTPKEGWPLPLLTTKADLDTNLEDTTSKLDPKDEHSDLETNMEDTIFSDSKDDLSDVETIEIHINYDEVKEKYENVMGKITSFFDKNFEMSPLEILTNVEKMATNLEKLKTPALFSSALATFGIGFGEHRRRTIPLQSRRKKKVKRLK